MLENEGVALSAIRWSEIFPWLSIGKSFRIAISLRTLAFGAAALLLTLLGWWGIAGLFSHDGKLNRSWSDTFYYDSAWKVIDHSVPDRPFPTKWIPSQDMPGSRGEPGLNVDDRSPLLGVWHVLSRPALTILTLPYPPMTARDVLSIIVSALWSLAVWAYFGAAISRVAAVELATGERVGWGSALRWARTKWLAYFSAPLIPAIGVALAVLPVLVLGWLMKLSFFAAVGGVIWPLVLATGFVMALLSVGLLLGWPLMWATISVEGTDSFDALSRTYAYVFQKPLRYLAYIVVAGVVGWLGWIVVENFAAAVIWLAVWAAGWGTGPDRMSELLAIGGDSSLTHSGAAMIAFWTGCVKLLALGYTFSYFGVASTAIYYLLRRDTDAREMDEVFLDADKSEPNFGLPKLQKDAAGAPEIAAALPVAGEPIGGTVKNETSDSSPR